MRRRVAKTWRCGCPRTKANTIGRKNPQCKTCKLERQRTYYASRGTRVAVCRTLPRSLPEYAPRPLPVRDTSERSYALAPLREEKSA